MKWIDWSLHIDAVGCFFSYRKEELDGINFSVGFYFFRVDDRSFFSFDYDTEYGLQLDVLGFRIFDYNFSGKY